MNLMLRALDEFCKSIQHDHPMINHGGCCVFASLLGNKLDKWFDDVAIRVSNDDANTTVDDVRSNIERNTTREWNRSGLFFGHVIVEFAHRKKWYVVDTTGVHPYSGHDPCFHWPLYEGSLTLKEAAELAADDNWNWVFPRDQIPAIQKKVNAFFRKVSK